MDEKWISTKELLYSSNNPKQPHFNSLHPIFYKNFILTVQ